MARFASTYQHFVHEERKVALLVAGLLSHVSAMVSNESVFFLRRAKTRTLGRTADAEVSVALRKTVEEGGRSIEDEALASAVEAIEGFPYKMQLVGFRIWDASPQNELIDSDDAQDGILLAREDFKDGVLDFAYRKISDGDLVFLEAMLPDDGAPSSLSYSTQRLGKSSADTRDYKSRLVAQGIIADERHGYVTFELPYFREYLEAKL